MTSPTDARLTRTDAQRRAELLTVHHEQVHLDLAGLAEGPSYRALVSIGFACAQAGAESFVDLCATTVHRVELNGVELDHASLLDGEHLRLPDLAEDNELLVEVTQERTSARAGLTRSVDDSDGGVYVWTQFEPYDAHNAWPCFDQPDLKTQWSFVVRVPAGWSAVSNSAPVDVVDDGDCRVWTFGSTPRLSAYVTAVCAGPFHVVRDQHGDLPLSLSCRRSLADRLDAQAEEWFTLTKQGLDFFGGRFGVAFPGDSYDQVFIAEMPGAMENFGCVTYSDNVVFRSPPTESARMSRTLVLLHEMAHMWFGDLVTMRWWDGLWLNESFATWAATWAAAAATSYREADAFFGPAHKMRGYAADRSPTTHPISTDVPDVATAEASFDQITYAKGASVLRQLVAWVGEGEFLGGLRAYFDRFGWGNADLAGLLLELERSSGRDLTEWSEQWLHAAGTSVLTPAVTDDGSTYSAVVIEQSAPAELPTLRSHRVGLGVYDRSGDRLELRQRIWLDVTGARTDVPALAGAPVADLLLLDDEDLTFALRRFDERSLATVLADAGGLPTAVARSSALVSLHELVLVGELAPADYLRCAVATIGREPVGVSLEALLASTIEVAMRCVAPDRRGDALADVAAACLAVLGSAEDGPLRRAALRGLCRTAERPDQLTTLEQALAAEQDQGLRWAMLTRLVAAGRADDAAVAAEQQRDDDPDAGLRALVARSAAADPAVKDALLERLFGDEPPPSSVLGALSAAFWQPDQDELLRPYASRFIAALDPRQGRLGWMAAWQLTRLMFPTAGVDEAFADEVAEAAAAAAGTPALASALRDAEDRVRRELAAQRTRPRL